MGIMELLYIIFMVIWLVSLGAYGTGPWPNRMSSIVPWIVCLILGLELFHLFK